MNNLKVMNLFNDMTIIIIINQNNLFKFYLGVINPSNDMIISNASLSQ